MDTSKKRYLPRNKTYTSILGIDLISNFGFKIKYVRFESNLLKSCIFPSPFNVADQGVFSKKFIRRMIFNKSKNFKLSRKFIIVKNIYNHLFLVKIVKC